MSQTITTPEVDAGVHREPRAFPLRLGAANLGLFAALLPPVLVTMALKVEAIAPDTKERALALVLGTGAFVALVVNPLVGRLSDRTRSRFGRRRPWLLGGIVLGTTGIAVVAFAPSVPVVLVGWILAQAGYNAVLSMLTATIPDQVPPERRGAVSGAMGMTQTGAILLGMIGMVYIAGIPAKFIIPAAVGLVLVTLFALTLPDARRATPAARFSLKEFAASFWVNPLKHPDFGWAWLTRFLVMFAAFTPTSYMAYYLPARIGVATDDVAATLGPILMAGYALTTVTAGVGGWLSDRFGGRRKAFVLGAAAVISAGLVLLITANSIPGVYLAQAVIGVGSGIFFAVDMALVTQVLPDPATAAKDLGVINIANALPQSLAPAVAPLLLAIGGGENYAALFAFAAAVGLAGAVLVTRIKGVR